MATGMTCEAGGARPRRPALRGLLLAAALALAPLPAAAEDPQADLPRQYILLGGSDLGATSSYSYAGVLTPLTGRFQGDDWVLRGWAEFLTYQTDDSIGELDARVAGGKLGLLKNFSVLDGNLSLGAGVVFGSRWYDRDTTQDDEGPFVRFRLEGNYQGEPLFERHHLNLFWSVTLPDAETWLRADYLFRGGDSFRIGPTASWSFGDDYSIIRAGLSAQEIVLTDSLRLSLAAGYESSDRGEGAFGSIGLTWLLGFQ